MHIKQNKITKIKKYAHELCGIAGPTSSYKTIDTVARQIENELVACNYDQIGTLLHDLNTIIDIHKRSLLSL